MAETETTDFTFWRDPALGKPTEFETSGGMMRAYIAGEGEPLVFVHGALVNANLWRKVVAELSGGHRCICLELPLGSHEMPMPNADLSPLGLANLIAEAVAALGLERPTMIANDTGGGLTQIAVTEHPELAGRLVLTSSDAYEQFPPKIFKYTLAPLRWPSVARLLFRPMRIRALRNTPAAFGWLTSGPIDEPASDSYVLPMLRKEGGQARDIARAWTGLDPKYTLEAARKLRSFDRPALIAWSRGDKFFRPANAERLAADIPGSRLEWIENARTFSAEDQPQRLAELIAEFVAETEVTATAAA